MSQADYRQNTPTWHRVVPLFTSLTILASGAVSLQRDAIADESRRGSLESEAHEGEQASAEQESPEEVSVEQEPGERGLGMGASGDESGGMPQTKVELGPYLSQGLDRAPLSDPRVKAAISRVPRHLFIPTALQSQAYADRALAIGSGQTISQPYIVAVMTEQAQILPGNRVLEIGTGSGYQSAVLAELGARVYSIEILPELSARAQRVLTELGYGDRITLRVGDGSAGWPEEAPFDAIIVTAAAPRVPSKLLTQLLPSGRLVLPLEGEGEDGERLVVLRKEEGRIVTKDLGGVRFVPLTGEVRTGAPSGGSEYPATERELGLSEETSAKDSQQKNEPMKR